MRFITEKTKERNLRNHKIKQAYMKAMKQEGAQKTAVYNELGKEHGIDPTQVSRIVGNVKVTPKKP